MASSGFGASGSPGPGGERCAKCGAALRSGARFCASCGNPVSSQVCPACNSANDSKAKFCAKCGGALGGQAPAPVPAAVPPAVVARDAAPSQPQRPAEAVEPRAPVQRASSRVAEQPPAASAPPPPGEPRRAEEAAPRAPRNRKPLFIGIGAVLLAMLIGAAAYGYWTGLIGDRPGSIARELTADLKQNGFDDVVVTMGQDWTARISGSVVGQDRKQALADALGGRPEIKSINLEALVVRPSQAEILAEVQRVLAAKRLGHFVAEVDDKGAVVLQGRALREYEIDSAVDAVKELAGVTSVDSRIGAPFTVVERNVNTALREAGFTSVRARVRSSDDISVTGTLREEGDRAAVINTVVESAGAVGETIDAASVRDEMTVDVPIAVVPRPTQRTTAAPAPTSTPAFESVEPVAAESPLVGVWDGRFRGALLPYVAAVEIRKGAGGVLAGETAYFGGGNLVCRGSLRMVSEQGGLYTFQEKRTEVRNTCPIRGVVRLVLSGSDSVQAEWSRPESPDNPSYKGTLKKRR